MDFFEIVNRFVEDLQTTFHLDHLGGHVSFMLLICHQLQWLGSLQSGRHVDPRWSADHNWTYLSPQVFNILRYPDRLSGDRLDRGSAFAEMYLSHRLLFRNVEILRQRALQLPTKVFISTSSRHYKVISDILRYNVHIHLHLARNLREHFHVEFAQFHRRLH